MLQVLGRQKHLGRMVAERRQRSLVGLDQQALTDGGHCLKVRQVDGPLREAQTPHSGAYRSGTYQHHFPARLKDLMQLFGKLGNTFLVELPILTSQHLRADFNYDCRGRRGDFLA